MGFFNWCPHIPLGGASSIEGSNARASGFPYPDLRIPMPFAGELIAAALHIGVNGNDPGQAFTASLIADGGAPLVSLPPIIGPGMVGTFLFPGLPVPFPLGAKLSWFAANGPGAGVVDAWTICGIIRRIGQPSPTRGLLSWQSGTIGSGPGATFRGMFDHLDLFPATDANYVTLALPMAGTMSRLVAGIRANTLDAVCPYGLVLNGGGLPPATAFQIPPGPTPANFTSPPPPAFPVIVGDLVTFGADGSAATVGGIAGTMSAQFDFP